MEKMFKMSKLKCTTRKLSGIFEVHGMCIIRFRFSGEISVQADIQYWIPVIFGPSGSIVLKTGMLLSWKSLHRLTVPSTNAG